MKKIILLFTGLLIGIALSGQTSITEITSGMTGATLRSALNGNFVTLRDSIDLKLRLNGFYPNAGIVLSTGSGWGTSITNNSANWNTAYGWGNHASGGYLTSVDISDLNTTGTASSSTYLRGDGAWTAVSSGGGMVYPAAGIAISTGSAWTTSIASNRIPVFGSAITGTASSSTYLRGDGSWQTVTSGSSTITDLGGTAWRVFYSNGSGDVTELALGADGTYLRSNGVSAAPTFSTPSGTGDMLASVYDRNGNDVVDEAETAATVTGFSRGSGSLALVGDDGITLNTTATTSVTLPTSGTLITDAQSRQIVNDSLNARIGNGITLSDVALMLDDTASMLSPYALLSEVGTGDVSISDVRDEINDSLNVLRPLYLPIADTASMLSNYALLSEVGSGSEVTITTVRNEIADSLNAIRAASVPGIVVADSNVYDGGYATPTWVDTQIAAVETGTVDSSLYVTVTRLTDSLNVMRILIQDLIDAMANVGVDIVKPTFASAEFGAFADDTILLVGSENFQQDSVPPASAFAFYEDENEFGIASVILSNDSLFIVLDSIGQYGSDYTLDYTAGTPALQDSSANRLNDFAARSVTNNFSDSAPYLMSAELGTYNDTIILALFNKNLDGSSLPAESDFTFEGGNTTIGLAGIIINNDSLFVAIDSTLTVFDDSTFVLSYTSGTNPLQSVGGTNVVSWNDYTVTNNLIKPRPNKVSNGTFDSTDGWTLEENISISGGTLNINDAFNTGVIQAPAEMVSPMESGVNYTISFDINVTSGLSIRMSIWCNETANIYQEWADYITGSYELDVTSIDPLLYNGYGIQLRFQGGIGTIDNFTITER